LCCSYRISVPVGVWKTVEYRFWRHVCSLNGFLSVRCWLHNTTWITSTDDAIPVMHHNIIHCLVIVRVGPARVRQCSNGVGLSLEKGSARFTDLWRVINFFLSFNDAFSHKRWSASLWPTMQGTKESCEIT